MADKAEVAALQEALAGVHAACWGYGVLGPKLGEDEARGTATYTMYRSLRNQLIGLLQARSADPVAAEPAYRLPFQVTGSQTARRLAAHLEDGCAAAFADLVAGAAGSDIRMLGARLLQQCAQRRISWGADPVAFPGLPEKR